ncbi:phosphatase PAP2 family protein [Sphingomonas sp. GC_Shp_6]|uniref:acid phosphatase n=1 Tax=Sphingomonas sp. GC_Shp_6 TaxID=2937378 RepID=UPI00226A5CB7|nr:phosphatase PAP2 family protein [Sphingomonas sp. GC_Shp_6]
MRAGRVIGAGLLAVLGIAAGLGVSAKDVHAGYLAPGAFDILAVLPPAPMDGDARDIADRAIFRATRALERSPRWTLATSDVKSAPADMMRDFGCALGVTLAPDDAPRMLALLRMAAADTGGATGIAKDHYRRHRPFAADPGATCEPIADTAGSYDYPSGHTTLGWTWATLLAGLAPDRATAILARGRAYGESRVVCGVHNASAVEAGRVSAAATLAAIAGDPRFQGDRAAAAAELTALRADPKTARPDAKTCAAEAALVAQRVY